MKTPSRRSLHSLANVARKDRARIQSRAGRIPLQRPSIRKGKGNMQKGRKPKQVNSLLRHEREKRGWSQARLAEVLGADTSMISRWECGERKPEPTYREKLCHLFGKSAAELGLLELPEP